MPVPDEFLQRMLDLAREVSRHLRGFYLAGGTAADYPGLSEEVRAALRRIAREVKAWRMDSG